jgi:hypothetical protein
MESIDFTGLAARAVAGLHEVRACLLASRDGLTLAVLPEGGEKMARRALDRLEAVGQPERGFLVIGDEVWVVARRGPYLGIVVAAATARAGLLLDRLESTLRAAEEARLQAGSASPGRPEIPRRPRTPLHREPRSEPSPSRSEMKPPNPLFEEVARVVSVPERESYRESSVGEASATTAWPNVIREPEAPNVGGGGSHPEPPTIFRPGVEREREPEEAKVATETPEVTSEPEEARVETPEPETEPEITAAVPELDEANIAISELQTEPEPDEAVVPTPELEAEPEISEMELKAETAETATEPEPDELNVTTSEREPDDSKVRTPEPEESKLERASETEVEEPDFAASGPEHAPEERQIFGLDSEFFAPNTEPERELPDEGAPETLIAPLESDSPVSEPEAPIGEPELDAIELGSMQTEPVQGLPKVGPARADEMRPEAAPEPAPEIPAVPRLAHPEVERPKPIPHYSPPEALLGEMGRVVAGETSPADILPPGVSPVETTGGPSDPTGEEAAEAAETKEPERSKERGEDTEVDPVALAREFAQLFDEPERNS